MRRGVGGEVYMGKLDNKCIVVTGASRGIGAEIARLFASEGGRVVCAARTLREGDHPLEGSLETTVTAIRSVGGEAPAVTADLVSQVDLLARIDFATIDRRPCAVGRTGDSLPRIDFATIDKLYQAYLRKVAYDEYSAQWNS